MKWRTIVCLFALLLCTAGLASAQAEAGRIMGTVTDAQTARPLVGASVTVVGSGRGALTGPNGQFVITGVSPGTHRVRAALLGFGSKDQSVSVQAGAAVTANFALETTAIESEAIVAVG